MQQMHHMAPLLAQHKSTISGQSLQANMQPLRVQSRVTMAYALQPALSNIKCDHLLLICKLLVNLYNNGLVHVTPGV
jgi:hypothetical protein